MAWPADGFHDPGALTTEAGAGSYPLVTGVARGNWPEAPGVRFLELSIDNNENGSDCGNRGVATFTIRGKSVRNRFKTSFKSAPGCLFKGGARTKGGLQLDLSVELDGSPAIVIASQGDVNAVNPRRKVRRVLYWTMHLTSKAGFEILDNQEDWPNNGPALLPYGGSDYTQSGTATWVSTYYPGRRAYWKTTMSHKEDLSNLH